MYEKTPERALSQLTQKAARGGSGGRTSIIDEMRRPDSSTEYREISNDSRAYHEVGPKEETGMDKNITTARAD